MNFAAVITLVVELPQANNYVEAELYGRNYADRIRENSEEPLQECKLQEVIDYEVD